MLPILELRGAIPIGISLGMSYWHATLFGILGSTIPVPFILIFLRPILRFFIGQALNLKLPIGLLIILRRMIQK